jgi:GUN4-like/DnaJ domain
MKPDVHYQVLELEPGVSQAEIKQAYRDLTLVWHPDRFFDNPRLRQRAEEKLKQINAAYAFLKSYQPEVHPEKTAPQPKQSVEFFLDCEKLRRLLEMGQLKDADHETKRLLLELASREQEGWLRPEDVTGLSPNALSAIDQLWIQYSNGRFGFSVQRQIWHELGCQSSNSMHVQTINENKFGLSVQWRVSSTWLSPWDSFTYSFTAPKGSLPREYIFMLSGWWSYLKGWTGYLLFRFDRVFLKLQ